MNKDITELLHKIDNSLDEIFDIFSKIHDDHVMERYKISSIFDNLFSHPLIEIGRAHV